jgi:hypothetical protein
MTRLLTPNGRICFSIETMHRENPGRPWFQIGSISKVMELIGRDFTFDFENLPETLKAERVTLSGAGKAG